MAATIGISYFLLLVFVTPFMDNTRGRQEQTAQQPSTVSTVIIPEGASLQNSSKHFEPSVIKVVIGQNNTVRWVNHDSVMSSVVADDSNHGSAFYDATQIEDNAEMLTNNFLLPNKSFEFTFTEAGEYGYHSVPHPWMTGTVIVVNEGHE
jgi:plastocyanin